MVRSIRNKRRAPQSRSCLKLDLTRLARFYGQVRATWKQYKGKCVHAYSRCSPSLKQYSSDFLSTYSLVVEPWLRVDREQEFPSFTTLHPFILAKAANMSVITVSRGTGKLSRAIGDALVSEGKHTTVVLAQEIRDTRWVLS